MTAAAWIALDHLAAVASAAAWFTCATLVATHRTRWTPTAFVVALVTTALRVPTVVELARAGWWFAQEKVLLVLPLTLVTAASAAFALGRHVRPRGARQREGPGSDVVGPGWSAAVVTAVLAGSAPALGLGVTLVAGYPLTWGTTLLAVGLLGGAGLLTARLLTGLRAPPGGTVPVATSIAVEGPSRRMVLAVVAAAAATATGAGLGVRPSPGNVAHGGAAGRPTVSVAELRGPRSSPSAGGRVSHVLTARWTNLRLGPGPARPARTYDGTAPGPAIRATQGDVVDVTLRNHDVAEGVTVHWHGYDVPCGEDGVPGITQEPVRPGGEFVYRFRADQAGTYWYHTHEASTVGVRSGLYGTFVVDPRGGRASGGPSLDLVLPVHTFERAMAIGDSVSRVEHMVPPGTSVRLRLLNTDSRAHAFALAGAPFTVTAADGRDLNGPGTVSHRTLRIAAGGRRDVVLEMPTEPVALVVDGRQDPGVTLLPEGWRGAVRVDPAATDGWPELDLLRYGRARDVGFDPHRPDRHFTMVLDRGLALVDGRPAYAHTVNGRAHPSVPDQLVAEGDTIRYTVVNRGLASHPWHLHGHALLVLARNTTPATGSPLWLDTVDIRPGEVWEVAFRATNPGIWMNHCHDLPHADQGMMLRLAYDGVAPFSSHHGEGPVHEPPPRA